MPLQTCAVGSCRRSATFPHEICYILKREGLETSGKMSSWGEFGPMRENNVYCPRVQARRGQALVEFSLVFPVFLVMLAVAFDGWNVLNSAVALTGAARAGAIVAREDVDAGKSLAVAGLDATAAVNAAEGVPSTWKDTACGTHCVTTSVVTGALSGSKIVEVVVTQGVIPGLPIFPALTVSAQAGVAE